MEQTNMLYSERVAACVFVHISQRQSAGPLKYDEVHNITKSTTVPKQQYLVRCRLAAMNPFTYRTFISSSEN